MKALIATVLAVAAACAAAQEQTSYNISSAEVRAEKLQKSLPQFNITPFVPETVAGTTANNRAVLLSRLNTALSRLGVLSQLGESRFMLTATVALVDKEVVNTAPPQVVCRYELTCGIGDGVAGVLYASSALTLKGVGQSEEKALGSALKQISADNQLISGMIRIGCTRIMEYYERNAPALLARAEAMCADDNYEEAIYIISFIPQGCSHYDEAMKKLAQVYQRYSDYNCAVLLTEASAAWAANPSIENAEDVMARLSGISPNASNYQQVRSFIQDVESVVKNDIDYERDKERTALNREFDLEQQRIDASREVALAYVASHNVRYVYKPLK